jgi:bacteriocin-like protein
MTDMRKPTSSERKVRIEGRVLSNDELEAISGGLSSMVSQVIKTFGEAVKASGRGA